MRHTRSNPERHGVTLVELLVVISIMLLLAAVAVPAMRPAMEGRRIREAARAINVYLSSARSEAMRTGRPVGVVLQRLEGQQQCSTVIAQAEIPPTYAGDTTDAKVRVQRAVQTIDGIPVPVLQVFLRSGDISDGLIRRSDRIQFNHQGPWYELINGPDYDTDRFFDLDDPARQDADRDGFIDAPLCLTARLGNNAPPWPVAPAMSEPVPFEIRRQPMKSTAKPLQLPAGAVVDLDASGTDHLSAAPLDWDPVTPGLQNNSSVFIMFAPDGAVRSLHVDWWYDNDTPSNPSDDYPVIAGFAAMEPIFLLVGRRERIADFTTSQLPTTPTADEKPNWADMGNLWVTITPQTGLVSVGENYPIDPATITTNFPGFLWEDATTWNTALNPTTQRSVIQTAREYARQAQSVGGR